MDCYVLYLLVHLLVVHYLYKQKQLLHTQVILLMGYQKMRLVTIGRWPPKHIPIHRKWMTIQLYREIVHHLQAQIKSSHMNPLWKIQPPHFFRKYLILQC